MMTLANASDVQFFIIAMSVLFTFWGVVWDKSDTVNIVFKIALIILAALGWCDLFHRPQIAHSTLLLSLTISAVVLCFIWGQRTLGNQIVKVSWAFLAIWGFAAFIS
jgi:hypothetical protein